MERLISNLRGSVTSADGRLRKPPGTTFCDLVNLLLGEDGDEEAEIKYLNTLYIVHRAMYIHQKET